jgi:hypothetical protein
MDKKFYLSKYKLEPFLFALGFCTVFQVIHYIPLPGIMLSCVCNKKFMDVAELLIMLRVQVGKTALSFGLVVVDMQNGFVSKGGSYDKLGMNIEAFRKIIPRMRILIAFCRNEDIPIFYTEAVRERSGIDLLTNIHMILPRTREERLKVPITVRGTWEHQNSKMDFHFHHSQSHWFCSRLHLPAQSAVIVLLFSWIRPFRTLENDLPSPLPLMPSHHRSLAIFSNSRFLHHQPAKYQSVRQNE